MLYSIRGELAHVEPGIAVVECAGVGYRCVTSGSTLSKLPPVGEPVKLYTFLYVKQDILELYGFISLSELGCFKMLINVSGVGPKAALGILSTMTPEKFALCVASSDIKFLTTSPGIGRKTAERIVLELRDKVQSQDAAAGFGTAAPSPMAGQNKNMAEALNAFLVLGYSQAEAAEALGGLSPELPVEELIRQGLKLMAGRVSG